MNCAVSRTIGSNYRPLVINKDNKFLNKIIQLYVPAEAVYTSCLMTFLQDISFTKN